MPATGWRDPPPASRPRISGRRLVALVAGLAAAAASPRPAAIAAPAPGTAIVNTATGTAASGGPVTSNTVTAIVQAVAPPALAFFGAPDYANVIRVSPLGQPLYVQATAMGCALDPAFPDTVTLTLRARLTGDRETYRAAETAPASGVFRISPNVATTVAFGNAATADGMLETRRGDEVTAELAGCGAVLTVARAWIEPVAVVFDARSGAPVPGVRVELVDVTGEGNGGLAGGPARVWLDDGVTPAPNVVSTDALGRYQFPRVTLSTYRLVVAPPGPFAFPATVPPASLPAGFLVDAAGSYGAPFRTPVPDAPVLVDVPLDATGAVTLFAEKSASRTTVELGDALDYAVRVANRSDSLLAELNVHDVLPPGFAYVRGTARRDDAPLADPVGGVGPALDFAIGDLDPHATATVRYQVRVGAGAAFGDALNRAVAVSGAHRSNTASARVRVDEGPFVQSATVVGQVSLLGDGGRRTDGVAGVRLWLDDGTFAITDALGRFSLTGVTPRTHALKVDPTTLPSGARLVSVDHRDLGQPGLRFVDLTRGELQRAEFAIAGDSITVRETGERRIAAAGRRDDLGRQFERGTAPLVAPPPSGDPRALSSHGITTGETTPPFAPAATPATPAVVPPRPSAPVALDQLMPALDPALGFVGLADFDTVSATQVAVRVKGRIGTTLTLLVNGQRVPESRVGARVTAPEAGIEAWEYVGVALRPGPNVLELTPPSGLGRAAVRLVAPGPLARLELSGPGRMPAGGRAPAHLTVRARDAAGVPVGARTLVTLETSAGTLRAQDLDPTQPGTQIAIEGGEASVTLESLAVPGEARVTATAGTLRGETRVRFLPDLRPLLAVGAVEGVVGLGRNGTFTRGPDAGAAHFESAMDQFVNVRRDGQAMAAAHGAVFMKGRVRDDVSVTLGYDSDRPADQRPFRDQQPDIGYPIVGDGATRGYEAQSTGRLYARLDGGPGSLLYGDFVTRDPGEGRSLAAYNRSLTGAQARWEERLGTVDAFTSRGRAHRRVEELHGLGLSGPYFLPGAPILENSEQVEIVVRDRNQPAMELSSSARQRFVDYELEPLTGRITFRAPVPSVDPSLNPVFVRVTYEVRDGGEPFWVSGVRLRVPLGLRFEAGGTYVDDHDPLGERELRGTFVNGQLGDHTRLEAELAGTRRLGEAAGLGSRLELSHEGTAAQGRLWAAATGERFDNPGSGFASGRTEGGARLSARLADRTRLNTEALWTADAAGHERRGGLLVGLDRTLSAALRGELGVRVFGEDRRAADDPPVRTTVRGRLSAQLPRRPAWSGTLEAEQDTRDAERRMLAVGGEYRLRTQGRIYARHELISSLGSPFALDAAQRQLTTVAGVDADLASDTHLFSEYRLGDSFAGREAQAAVGLRNGWRLDNGVRLGTQIERVSPLRGSDLGPTSAASVSLEFVDGPEWRGSTRWEVRSSRASDSYLESMAAAVRLDSAWTALFRNYFDLTYARGMPSAARIRLQVGAAWRPGGDWDGIGRWELRYDRDGAGPTPRGASAGAGGTGLTASASHRRLAQIVALQLTGMLDQHLQTSIAWAGKLARDGGPTASTTGGAQWARGRTTLDLAHGWDVGIQSSLLVGSRFADRRYGLGAELGRLMSPGLWLSLGFNHFGYQDDELTGADWTRAGVYLRLRAKFDEQLFGVGDPGHNDAGTVAAGERSAR